MVRRKRKSRKKKIKRKRKKRIRRKPRIGFFLTLLTLTISGLIILYISSNLIPSILPSLQKVDSSQKVEILYFRNDRCPIVETTDTIINQAIAQFGDRISVEIINAQLYPSDPPDTEEVKQLREKYNVIGLPDIIINGKKFTKQFNRNNLFSEICNNFIVKPEVCK